MNLDAERCNLKERDIEDYLWENPQLVYTGSGNSIDHWIARQLHVPSGIIDLFGVTGDGTAAVVEIKNVTIDSRAIVQVCRYAKDIETVLERAGNFGVPERVVVGPDIDNNALFEANAVDVHCMHFTVDITVKLGGVGWTAAFRERMSREYQELAASPLFAEFVPDVEPLQEPPAE